MGSAFPVREVEITPTLVSRYYRAPEISMSPFPLSLASLLTLCVSTVVMGAKYDCSIDTWAAGCTVFEMSRGHVLFPGDDNNHMLKVQT